MANCPHAPVLPCMVHAGDELCLPCASRLFEATRDQSLLPAYLLEHGHELDQQDAPGRPRRVTAKRPPSVAPVVVASPTPEEVTQALAERAEAMEAAQPERPRRDFRQRIEKVSTVAAEEAAERREHAWTGREGPTKFEEYHRERRRIANGITSPKVPA